MENRNIKNMDVRFAAEKIEKGNWGINDFIQYFNCDEDAVEKRLQSIFIPKELNKIRRSLKKNDKKQTSRKPQKTTNQARQCDDTTDPTSVSLQQLEKQRNDAELKVINLDCQYAARVELQNRCREKLNKYQDTLGNLRKRIINLKANYDDCIIEFNKLDDEMANIKKQKSVEQHNVDQLQEQIKQLNVVTIWVYENGTFCSEPIDYFADEAFNDELFQELLHSDHCNKLLLGEIKTLTYVLSVTRKLKKLGKHIDFAFHNNELEIAYRALES